MIMYWVKVLSTSIMDDHPRKRQKTPWYNKLRLIDRVNKVSFLIYNVIG